MPTPRFDDAYHECIKRLGEFPNIRSITVHFDRHAGQHRGEYGILQDQKFQRKWLRRILHSIQTKTLNIAVRHYQNHFDSKYEVPMFIDNIAKMGSLRMSIKHVQIGVDTGTSYYASLL